METLECVIHIRNGRNMSPDKAGLFKEPQKDHSVIST